VAQGNDILHLFPELAAIGRQQLQAYCDEWLLRPMARQYGVSLIAVSDDLLLCVNLDRDHVEHVGDRMFIPIDQLLAYIVERHFTDPAKRRQLYQCIRDARLNSERFGRDYEATVGRSGRLYLTCKTCHAELETSHEGVEGWAVTCPPAELTCPACGAVGTYDGDDLHLLP
jgi:hypothetical protein